jgi:hypothetical protein
LGPIDQIVFIDDFEASMWWVIGLSGQRLSVDILQDPLVVIREEISGVRTGNAGPPDH